MDFARSKDESLLHFLRKHSPSGGNRQIIGRRYPFVGGAAKQYADRIREELDRRRL
jgi:hypothetical protein